VQSQRELPLCFFELPADVHPQHHRDGVGIHLREPFG
jgi:hypothetical protein